MKGKELDQIHQTIIKKIGSPILMRSQEESIILSRLQYFQEAYKRRNDDNVENFVEELVDNQIQIIGTNGVFPHEDEFSSGKKAAINLFRNDWKYWGDLELFIDYAEINIEDNSAWTTVFGTITIDSKENDDLDFEEIKLRVFRNVKEIIETQKEKSTLALHHIIHEANTVLYQYQQGNIFVWPLRISFAFLKKSHKWMIKQIHFSHPISGFPPVRL